MVPGSRAAARGSERHPDRVHAARSPRQL